MARPAPHASTAASTMLLALLKLGASKAQQGEKSSGKQSKMHWTALLPHQPSQAMPLHTISGEVSQSVPPMHQSLPPFPAFPQDPFLQAEPPSQLPLLGQPPEQPSQALP